MANVFYSTFLNVFYSCHVLYVFYFFFKFFLERFFTSMFLQLRVSVLQSKCNMVLLHLFLKSNETTLLLLSPKVSALS